MSTLSKIQPLIHQKQQNKMSNLKKSQKYIMCFAVISQGKTLRSYGYIQPNSWEKTPRSNLYFIQLRIIKWMINDRYLLWLCTYVPELISLPHTQFTHTHTIQHTKLFLKPISCDRKYFMKKNDHKINIYTQDRFMHIINLYILIRFIKRRHLFFQPVTYTI